MNRPRQAGTATSARAHQAGAHAAPRAPSVCTRPRRRPGLRAGHGRIASSGAHSPAGRAALRTATPHRRPQAGTRFPTFTSLAFGFYSV